MGQGLYVEIWKQIVTTVNTAIENNENYSFSFNPEAFYAVGNRKEDGYRFRTEFENGNLVKCANSAVARDLVEVMEDSSKFRECSKGKHVVLRMGKNFDFHIEIETL